MTTGNLCQKCEDCGWFWVLNQPIDVLEEIFKDIEFNSNDLKMMWDNIQPMLKICDNPKPIEEFIQKCQQKISNTKN